MTELTGKETLERLNRQGIETIVPEQPVMLACGVMGNPSGNDIIDVKAPEPGVTSEPNFTFNGPEYT